MEQSSAGLCGWCPPRSVIFAVMASDGKWRAGVILGTVGWVASTPLFLSGSPTDVQVCQWCPEICF